MVQKTVKNDQRSGVMGVAISAAKMAALPPGSVFGLTGMVRRHRAIVDIVLDAIKIPAPIPLEERKSYQEWIDELGLAPADIVEIRNQMLLESRITYVFSLLAIMISLSFAFDGNFVATVSGLAGAWICAVSGFCRNFRVFQHDRKTLCDFSVYLRSPEGWIV